jgi:hypothetical protein
MSTQCTTSIPPKTDKTQSHVGIQIKLSPMQKILSIGDIYIWA